MLKLVLILTFTSLLVSCIGQNPGTSTLGESNAGIVGGEEVSTTSDFSKMVVLIRGLQESTETVGNQSYIRRAFDVCTGTFISEDIVLTAAHCIFEEPYKLEIVYTTDVKDFSAPTAQVEKIIKHPSYSITPSINAAHMNDDIALIKIAGKKPADYKILDFARIPTTRDSFSMIAIGYGRTTGLPATPEDTLQGLGVLRQTKATVAGFNKRKNFFYTNQTNGHGVCSGDSGGPGFIQFNKKYYILGVATAAVHSSNDVPEDGSDIDVCKFKAAYSNVQYYADWITQSMKALKTQ